MKTNALGMTYKRTCICVVCGARFLDVGAGSPTKACSEPCARVRRREHARATYARKKKTGKRTAVCATCHRDFCPTHPGQQCCSNRCGGKRPKTRVPVKRRCAVCRRVFRGHHLAKFCSARCRGTAARQPGTSRGSAGA